MSDVNMKIMAAAFSGTVTGVIMVLITTYVLAWTAIKEVKFAKRRDVERCINSRKFTQEMIMRVKTITPESSCILQGCDEYSVYADSGTLSTCFCGTIKEL